MALTRNSVISATWAIANLSEGDKTRALISSRKPIPALMQILRDYTNIQKEDGLRALTFLAVDKVNHEILQGENVVPLFVELLQYAAGGRVLGTLGHL